MEINDATFDAWNSKKKSIQKSERKILFKEGDIWWCSIGQNVGTEACGKGDDYKRPVFILRKLSENAAIALPTTTRPKKGPWFHKITINSITRWIMLHQARHISKNRLWIRESQVKNEDIAKVKEAFITLISPKIQNPTSEGGVL